MYKIYISNYLIHFEVLGKVNFIDLLGKIV